MIPRTLSSDLPVGYHHSFFKTLKVMPVQIAPNLEMGYQDNLTEIQERWRDDPDVVFRSDGSVHFIGPGGRQESVDEHVGRLKHNGRMRFNRQVRGQSSGIIESMGPCRN